MFKNNVFKIADFHWLFTTVEPEWAMAESIAHEAEGKIQLVGQKNIKIKRLLQVKARHQSFFTAKTLQIWRALFATRGLERSIVMIDH